VESYAEQNTAPVPEMIKQQLRRLLESPEFQATDRQRELLKFVVSETLAGNCSEIKGYTIATRVFDRKENFDQATDPIVSIQAGLLRRALERYYLVAGPNDPVRIDIPKGTYVPTFIQPQAARSEPAPEDELQINGFAETWPTLLIRPFLNLTGNDQLEYLAIGLATELAVEISRSHEIRVMLMPNRKAGQRRSEDSGTRFLLDGGIKKGVSGLKVNVSLADTSTGLQIWGDSLETDFDPSELMGFQEEVAHAIAGQISCEYGIIAKTLSRESKQNPPMQIGTYEAILRYYDFNVRYSAETFYAAFDALRHASRHEPDCGLVWSMRARLYADNYSLELFDRKTPLEKAAAFAERGVLLEPANQRARLILAFIRLFENEISAGLAEAERALALNPNSLIFLEYIGYMMTLLGDWQRGPALIRKAISANPYYSSVVHYALWVDWVRRKAYEKAFLETHNFRAPTLFWDPLLKAGVLGLLGKKMKGKQALDDLLILKPDFAKRGKALIGHYIKFEDIFERLLAGMSKAGLRII
jgi:adenylate cyclase